ncbi:hypothetical protein SBOR_2310 [Sclerotinia borealis F-4128]|uniref:Uncharacterized protein n=1 Tax=Sclerotinia borealis (strain F-4128) TaxID=1432307 RepID=W9CKF1_SCLBF|nr:hypothetical protein SBOR_2310 [Sclerotinia borealis F-4128]
MAPPSFRTLLLAHNNDEVAASEPATLTPEQIPRHRWVSFGGETLALSIDLTEAQRPLPTDISNFHDIVALHAVYTKTCLVSVTLPTYGHDVTRSNHSRIFCHLVTILNGFPRIARLEVVIRMPFENFTQLTNACHFYRLDFKAWKLFCKVGTWDVEQIHVGSQMDRRLNGWFKVNIAGSA